MRRISSVSMFALITGALATSNCAEGSSEVSADLAAGGDSAVDSAIDTVGQLTQIGQELYELEERAVIIAFGDPSGQTEGQEERYHTFYGSSLSVLAEAVRRDSTAARAWYWYGQGLTRRAYRGFGEWDLSDQADAVHALERAVLSLDADDPLRPLATEMLELQRGTLQALRADGR